MPSVEYRGLPEFGLPLVTPEDPRFTVLVREIEKLPQLLRLPPPESLRRAAVLLNESGKAIVALGCVWQYAMRDGTANTRSFSNLGSSTQMDFLSGRTGAAVDLDLFVLPGSKRLITEEGTFGSNLDVLPPPSISPGGYLSAGVGGSSRRRREEAIAAVELRLDLAIFEDGVCAGPDQFGLAATLAEDLERQRGTAGEIVVALRSGASPCQIFELVRPLARERRRPGHHSPVLGNFAHTAIHYLIESDQAELAAWFESLAAATPIRLRRP